MLPREQEQARSVGCRSGFLGPDPCQRPPRWQRLPKCPCPEPERHVPGALQLGVGLGFSGILGQSLNFRSLISTAAKGGRTQLY